MAEEYVCGECGQRSEDDYCPICESKMVKLNDFNDSSYEVADEEEDEFETMDGGFGSEEFEEDELPSVA